MFRNISSLRYNSITPSVSLCSGAEQRIFLDWLQTLLHYKTVEDPQLSEISIGIQHCPIPELLDFLFNIPMLRSLTLSLPDISLMTWRERELHVPSVSDSLQSVTFNFKHTYTRWWMPIPHSEAVAQQKLQQFLGILALAPRLHTLTLAFAELSWALPDLEATFTSLKVLPHLTTLVLNMEACNVEVDALCQATGKLDNLQEFILNCKLPEKANLQGLPGKLDCLRLSTCTAGTKKLEGVGNSVSRLYWHSAQSSFIFTGTLPNLRELHISSISVSAWSDRTQTCAENLADCAPYLVKLTWSGCWPMDIGNSLYEFEALSGLQHLRQLFLEAKVHHPTVGIWGSVDKISAFFDNMHHHGASPTIKLSLKLRDQRSWRMNEQYVFTQQGALGADQPQPVMVSPHVPELLSDNPMFQESIAFPVSGSQESNLSALTFC